MTYRFGPYTADRTAYRVFAGDRTVELTPKLLDLLFFLLERPATLVTKEELLDGVWPDANVTDNALAQAISELREALGDVPSAPSLHSHRRAPRIPVHRAGRARRTRRRRRRGDADGGR